MANQTHVINYLRLFKHRTMLMGKIKDTIRILGKKNLKQDEMLRCDLIKTLKNMEKEISHEDTIIKQVAKTLCPNPKTAKKKKKHKVISVVNRPRTRYIE